MKLFQVKLFKNALWAVVATLWALPVAAQSLMFTTPTSFDTQIGFDVNSTTGVLNGAVFESIWSVRDSAELGLFEAADYAMDFELTNASLTATTGDFVIAALDDFGGVVTSSEFDYVIDDSVVPNRLKIDSGDLSSATSFVQGISVNPSLVRLVLRPIVYASRLSTSQEVRIQSWWRWNDTLVAIDDAKLPVF